MTNKYINTGDNVAINDLLCMIEGLSCFSEAFERKIVQLSLTIVANGKQNQQYITDSINNLYTLMKSLTIFNIDFINTIKLLLEKGFEFENKK